MSSTPSAVNPNDSFLASLSNAPLTLAEYASVPQALKEFAHWVCYRYELNKKTGKWGNAPYRVDGTQHAASTSPKDWSGFDDAVKARPSFDGLSFMLLGTDYLGFDFDNVIHDGRLDPYIAAIVRLLGDFCYCETSPSGTGLRVFVQCPDLKRPAKTQFKTPTCAVEIYHGSWAGKALTVTGKRYSGTSITKIDPQRFHLVHLLCSQIGSEKFKKLWVGEWNSAGNYPSQSEADFALCSMLAAMLDGDTAKIASAFRFSGLFRQEKIDKSKEYLNEMARKAAESYEQRKPTKTPSPSKNQLVFHLPAVSTSEVNDYDYVIAPIPPQTDGWFPRGSVSLVGAPSGAGKTTLIYQLLLTQASKGTFLGHETYGLSFCVMGIDRGEAAHRRTMRRMRLRPDAVPFEVLSLAWDFDAVQQIIDRIESRAVLPNVLLVEGVDLLVSKMTDIKAVTIFMNLLSQVAHHYHIAVIGTLGSPKIKMGQGYAAKRDNLLGSVGWGRECETILNLQFPKNDDTASHRKLFVLLRNDASEKFTLGFENGQLVIVPDTDGDDDNKVSQEAREVEWYKDQGQKWWTTTDMERELNMPYSTVARHVADACAKQIIRRKPGKKKGKGEAAQYRWNDSKKNPKWTAESTEPEELF